jgi:hypothetical protein
MTTRPHAYTAAELLTILSARQLSDGQVVFAGIGIPLLAASLAQRLVAIGAELLAVAGNRLVVRRWAPSSPRRRLLAFRGLSPRPRSNGADVASDGAAVPSGAAQMQGE